MREFKWKGNEVKMQQMVNLHGVSGAAKHFGVSELLFRKACHNYKIKIPEQNLDYQLSEAHPKIKKWIKRRNEIMLSMPFGNVEGGL